MAKKKKGYEDPSKNLELPKAKSDAQAHFIDSVLQKEMIVVTGPAGTGKTFLSAYMAAYMYQKGRTSKIVLTRPTVPTGKSIGFFPGTLNEKMEPWVQPFLEVLKECLSAGEIECMIKNGNLEIVPFEVIRGRSFNDAFVILDEAQNSTYLEIKAFTTRHGNNSTTIINGDISQSDLNGSGNGLEVLLDLVKTSYSLQNFLSVVEFNDNDIVRSNLCRELVKEYSNLERKQIEKNKNKNNLK